MVGCLLAAVRAGFVKTAAGGDVGLIAEDGIDLGILACLIELQRAP
jgi:hypothetical protein